MRLGVCPICGGRTDDRTVDVLENLDQGLIVIGGIRAEVCIQCGEKLYAETEMRRIEDIRRKIKNKEITPARLEQVLIFKV